MNLTPFRSICRLANDLLFSSSVSRCLYPAAYYSTSNKKSNESGGSDLLMKDGTPIYEKPKLKLLLQGMDLSKYTIKPIPYPKTGGRSWYGRVYNKRMGGGSKQLYRMIDFRRLAPSKDQQLEEKVLQVRYDALRTADIALVGQGTMKRWIIASDGVKVGDIIKTSADIPEVPVKPIEKDAYAVGALPIGTVIHNIERYPSEGGRFARAGGSAGTIIRKIGDRCIVRLPSKREVNISQECMAVVGRVSNVNHKKEPIGSPNRARWFGIRPKSGLFHKKTGYHGQKVKGPRQVIVYDGKTKPLSKMFDT